jgi:triacylglycerol esterase/lipase EstA (alpha/beta hydrolase family)
VALYSSSAYGRALVRLAALSIRERVQNWKLKRTSALTSTNGFDACGAYGQLNPAGKITERAEDLKNYLQNNTEVAGKKIHLIPRSMGRLDARYLISKLGMADRVLSLTTIGAPHHGSPIADWSSHIQS